MSSSSSAATDQHSPRYRGKSSPYKGLRSCTNCQKAKQRCDINRDVIRPGPIPQLEHLACHRCKVLKLPCILDAPAEDRKRRSSVLKSSHTAAFIAADVLAAREEHESTDAPPSKARKARVARSTAKVGSSSSSLQRGEDDKIHVFDPSFETDGFKDEGASRRTSYHFKDESFQIQQAHPNIEVGDALRALRPYSYLYRLCSIQPNFLAVPDDNGAGHSSLRQILQKHAADVDWQTMNLYLQDYRFFLPFLDLIDIASQLEEDELYLATKIYLSALRTDRIELVADLHALLRQEVLSCVRSGPASIGEASALVALALYEPLIIAKNAGEIQLDGSDLLAAASSTLRTKLWKNMPYSLQNHSIYPNHDPSPLLFQCSLWIATAFISGFNTLASDVSQRPCFECTLEDVNLIGSFCQRILQTVSISTSPSSSSASSSPSWCKYASHLKLLAFRHHSVLRFYEIAQSYLTKLESIPMSAFGLGEVILVEGITETYQLAKKIYSELRLIGRGLTLPAHTCNMLMDYIEFETEQLHMFCLIHFTEACLCRIATCYGRPIGFVNLVQRMTRDEAAARFAQSVVFTPKRDISRKLVTLFSNFSFRWCSPRDNEPQHQQQHQQQQESLEKRGVTGLALPPASVSAMMLNNIKTTADCVGGLAHIGIIPRDCIDDCEAAMTVFLCKNHGDALRLFVASDQKSMYRAKGHGDLFQMTADIAIRTGNAIHEWAAATKGIRVVHPSSFSSSSASASSSSISQVHTSHQQGANRNRHQFEHVSAQAHPQMSSLSPLLNPDKSIPMETLTDFQGQDLERLLEQILSTPIPFT